MRKFGGRLALIVLCAGAGIALGLAMRGSRRLPQTGSPAPSTNQATFPVHDEFESLQQRAAAQAVEIARLQAAVPVVAVAPADKKAIAKRMLDLEGRIEDLNDAEKKEWLRTRGKVDREMAPIFAEGYRARLKEGASIVTELPLHLVWNAGGPEGAELLMDRLEDSHPVSHERNAILLMISGTRLDYHEMEPFTITPRVASKARAWMTSEDYLERAASAGMLGGMDASEARPALLNMLADPHLLVRAAAIKALGRVGDDAALERLLAFQRSEVQTLKGPNWPDLNPALRAAIQRLYQEKLKREGK